MSGTNIRVVDLPDLGTVTDASSFVIDKATTTGRFSALAVKNYCAVATIPEAPSDNTPYGRRNGAWSPVLGDAPSNGLPYARLNAAWSAVVPEAPLTGSIYGRGSSGWTPVLPITGGTISGNLGTTGNVTVGGAVYSQNVLLSAANGYEWNFYVMAGSGDHMQQHRAGWYDQWLSASGMRAWVGPSGTLMTLDGTGNLVTGTSVQATQHWSGTPGQFGFAPGGSGRIFQWQSNFYLDFATSGPTAGTLQYVDTGGPLWVMRASDQFCFNPQSSVGGNGAYLNISDRRAKSNIVPTTKGLAEIIQLQPVEFDRANPATGSQHEIGLIAQDVQPIVPEAVWQAGIPLRDGTGGLDTATPTLALSSETLTALNINAIKELNGLIGGLAARIQTLEGRIV